jgi:pSer/pThr/pTyr-binding forkhead associated (FHA) protein
MQLCPNCGHNNRAGIVFCENCGASLIGKAPIDTKSLGDSTEEEKAQIGVDASVIIDTKVQGVAVFDEGALLRLEIEGSPEPILFKPKAETIFGRRDPATGAMPDIDLTPFAGYRMGVSRRHAAIRFGDGRALDLWDLGSSNGTFLNGQRLSAHRPYHMHDGDELRLGQMVIKVYFQPVEKPVTEAAPAAGEAAQPVPPAEQPVPAGPQAVTTSPITSTISGPQPTAVSEVKDSPVSAPSVGETAHKPGTAPLGEQEEAPAPAKPEAPATEVSAAPAPPPAAAKPQPPAAEAPAAAAPAKPDAPSAEVPVAPAPPPAPARPEAPAAEAPAAPAPAPAAEEPKPPEKAEAAKQEEKAEASKPPETAKPETPPSPTQGQPSSAPPAAPGDEQKRD